MQVIKVYNDLSGLVSQQFQGPLYDTNPNFMHYFCEIPQNYQQHLLHCLFDALEFTFAASLIPHQKWIPKST